MGKHPHTHTFAQFSLWRVYSSYKQQREKDLSLKLPNTVPSGSAELCRVEESKTPKVSL
ncbi:rCG26794 [Rattus norvegicus]|uniref:RCG26794 n=1 Tax=Rattus norvegicus TaxID=10116 RepID=A6HQL0_RAT|nr:rCG26794 [Rattus norvegicus]